MTTKILDTLKRRANQIKMEAYAIYLAYKDPRVPWYAKILIACVVGYAFSPIDKLLSSIPIIGYLDHLILVPLGVALTFKKMIPSAVLTDCRQIAMNQKKPINWVDGSITIFICFLFGSIAIVSTIWVMKDWNLVLGQWFRWFIRMTLISESNARSLSLYYLSALRSHSIVSRLLKSSWKAKPKTKKVRFNLYAPEAERVLLARDFNDWDVNSLPMKKDSEATWWSSVALPPARYEYRFWVDGVWHDDPNAQDRVGNLFGSQNCIRIVS